MHPLSRRRSSPTAWVSGAGTQSLAEEAPGSLAHRRVDDPPFLFEQPLLQVIVQLMPLTAARGPRVHPPLRFHQVFTRTQGCQRTDERLNCVSWLACALDEPGEIGDEEGRAKLLQQRRGYGVRPQVERWSGLRGGLGGCTGLRLKRRSGGRRRPDLWCEPRRETETAKERRRLSVLATRRERDSKVHACEGDASITAAGEPIRPTVLLLSAALLPIYQWWQLRHVSPALDCALDISRVTREKREAHGRLTILWHCLHRPLEQRARFTRLLTPLRREREAGSERTVERRLCERVERGREQLLRGRVGAHLLSQLDPLDHRRVRPLCLGTSAAVCGHEQLTQ
eukprot:scaffold97398_cov30-Tisochrysis_lutea.AAC.2